MFIFGYQNQFPMKKAALLFALFSVFYTNAQCVQSFSAGNYTTFIIKTDGTLWGCGGNFHGMLGDGTTTDRNTFVQIGTATNWKMVSGKGSHTIALKTDGSLWAWGNNIYGQLGDGTSVDKVVPTRIGTANDWKTISATYWSNLAMKNNGTLWAWGFNQDYGQLGDGTHTNRNTPIQIGSANDWKSICAGAAFSVAIKNNGTLWAWGTNQYGQFGNGTTLNSFVPLQIGTATDWKQVLTGEYHLLALKNNGTLYATGNGYFGVLGNGNTASLSTLTQIGTATDWDSIGIGRANSIAIKSNGTLWLTGHNFYGAIGNGTTTQQDVFQQLGNDSDWQAAQIGDQNAAALKTNGSLFAWGDNFYGQSGSGTNTNSLLPVAVACPQLETETFSAVNQLFLYPNPVKSVLYVQFAGAQQITSLSISDMCGKQVLEQSGNVPQVAVENLEMGIYILNIHTQDKVYREKFIRE